MEFHVIWRKPSGERVHNVFLSFEELLVWLIKVIKEIDEFEVLQAYARLENEKL